MVMDFVEGLVAEPEYDIQVFDVSEDEIMLCVGEYNDAQQQIPEFAYGRKITIIRLERTV